MKKFYLLIFLVVSGTSAFSQNAKKKNLTFNAGVFDKLYSTQIPVFPYFYTDSISDTQLLSTLDKLPEVSTSQYYVLYQKDSTRYAVTLFHSTLFNRYSLIHYLPDGSLLSIAQYNKDHLLSQIYREYYPWYRIKTQGRYKNGIKTGTWRFFDTSGKLLKKENYRGGALKRSKELSRPRRTWQTLLFRNGVDPLAYRISETNDTSKIKFGLKKYKEYDQMRGFANFSLHNYTMDLAGLRSDPYMLNKPADNIFLFGTGINLGDRRKFFINSNLYVGFSAGKTATYQSIPLRVSNFCYRYNFLANVPLLGRKEKTTLFLLCGTEFASLFSSSEYNYPVNSKTHSYYLAAQIDQNWLINTGLMLDHIYGKGRQGFFTSVFIKAGYNFSPLQAIWYDNSVLQKPKLTSLPMHPVGSGVPFIDLGGFYITVGLNTWKGKTRRIKA